MNQQTNDRLEAILSNDYRFQFGEYISKGFNLFGRNAGMFIGYLLLSGLITVLIAIIPLLGIIALLGISGALSAGNFIVADKTERGEYVEFGNFFDGFKSWLPLMLNLLLQGVVFFVACIPFIAYLGLTIGFSTFTSGDRPEFSAAQGTTVGFLVLAFFCLLIYLSYSFIYAPFFIVFEKMDAWEAMNMSRRFVSKHFFVHFFFYMVWGFIITISCLPFFLGLLVTIPALSCSIYAAWADITDYHVEKTEDDDLMRHLID